MASNFGIKFFTRGFATTTQQMDTVQGKSRAMQSGFMQLGRRSVPAIGSIVRAVFSLKGAIGGLVAGYGLKRLADSFINTASKMDTLKLSLDTITKGRGEEWFRKLNQWAMKMPVNTERAIDAFRMLRAMGLEPSIKDMTILVDTTSALGGGADVLDGIARALGQIKTKGKVSSEELMQLAERGIPAIEILRQKLGLSAEDLENVGKAGVDAGQAVRALLEGMAERFGGQSTRIQAKWSGMIESLKSYYTEFKRSVMDAGPMRFLEAGLGQIVKKLDELRASGRFDEFAKKVGGGVIDVIANVVTAIGWLPTAFYTVKNSVHDVLTGIAALGSAAVDVIAVVAATANPVWALKVALKGYRETFPTLAKLKDSIDDYGTSQATASLQTDQAAKKFANYGAAIEGVAEKLRAMKFEKITPPVPRKPEVPEAARPIPIDEKEAKKREDLQKQLSARIRQLTLSDYQYKKWLLDQEGKDLLEKYDQDERMMVLISQFIRASHKKLDDEYSTSLREKAEKDDEAQKALVAREAEANRAIAAERKAAYADWLEEYGSTVDGIKAGLDSLEQKFGSVFQRIRDLTINVAQSMEQTFSTYFFDVLRGEAGNFLDYMTRMFQRLAADLAAQLVMINMVKAAAGASSLWTYRGGAVSPSIRPGEEHWTMGAGHKGGILGMTSFPTRSVPATVFAGAQRYHGGMYLRSNEVPFIGESGELLLSKADVAQMREKPAGLNVQVNVINESSMPVRAEPGPVRFDFGAAVIDVVLRDLDHYGRLRQTLGRIR